MTRTTTLFSAVLLLVTASVGACSNDATPTDEAAGCEAGASQTCTCAAGGSGTQSCTEGKLAECACAAPLSEAGDSAVAPVDASPAEASVGAGDGGPRDGGGDGPREGGGGDGGGREGGGGGGGGGDGGGGGGVPCTVAADCSVAGACPPDATKGCGCKVTPTSTGRCAPICTVNTDCAPKPGQTMVCKADGFCAPGS